MISYSLLLLLSFATSIKASNQNNGPVCPTVYVGSDGAFELFWFHPGLHRQHLGNIHNSVDAKACIGTATEIYGVATRFSISPPVMIDSVMAFISDSDPFPELPGNQYSPIGLFLKRRECDDIFSDFWIREVALDSGSSQGGEIVSAPAKLSLTRDFEFWAGYEWLASHPTSPMMGICHSPKLPEQYIYQRIDSVYNLRLSPEGFMLGLDLLHWSGSPNGGSDYDIGQDSITFSILFAKDTVDFFDSSVRLDSVGSDSLLSRLDIEESGYVCILAWDGVDSAASKFVFLDKDKIPNLQVAPPFVDGKMGADCSDTYSIYLTNVGSDQLCARLIHDSSLITLSDSSVCLAQGEQVEIVITADNDEAIDSAIATDLVIETSGETYPLLYHMILRPGDPTSVPDVRTKLRPVFHVTPASPNPFNNGVEFAVEPGEATVVEFQVFNLLGQAVYRQNPEIKERTTIRWEGRDDTGRELPSGLYFFRFASGEYTVTRKALLIK